MSATVTLITVTWSRAPAMNVSSRCGRVWRPVASKSDPLGWRVSKSPCGVQARTVSPAVCGHPRGRRALVQHDRDTTDRPVIGAAAQATCGSCWAPVRECGVDHWLGLVVRCPHRIAGGRPGRHHFLGARRCSHSPDRLGVCRARRHVSPLRWRCPVPADGLRPPGELHLRMDYVCGGGHDCADRGRGCTAVRHQVRPVHDRAHGQR